MSGSVTKTIDLPASASDVWAIVGDFNGLPNWNAGVERSELSNGGKRRTLYLKVGGTVVEDLLEHDNAARRVSYSIIESAVPVGRHKATMTVHERGPGQSMVHWTCEFEPEGAPVETVESIFSRIFEGGLKQLADVVGARRR
jgi:uncharacterized protein YndB with AHSA1/START domain